MTCHRVESPYGGRRIDRDADAHAVCRFFDVSRESCERLATYVSLLERWQSRINLVSRKTLGMVWARHVADGLQLLPHIPQGPVELVDLGSGSGVPGLILALTLASRREVSVRLVESHARKAAFLRTVIRETGIRAMVINSRIEAVDWATVLPHGVRAIILARALAPLPQLLELAWPLLARGAQALWHKGQDVEREIADSTRCWQLACEMIPSVTDPRGVILKIDRARRIKSRQECQAG